jgi:uncharacterized membrane-anchored protein YitT (DUF2179 family)
MNNPKNNKFKSLFDFTHNTLSVLLGIFLATLGINGFLLPNHFIDGGVTGTSMLISGISGADLSLILLLINTPFVMIGVYRINWKFALRSALAIFGLAFAIHFASFPILTSDKLLSAIFGGISLGAGIGFALRGGAVLDGTEILAIILSKKFRVKVGDIILMFNTFIFSIGAFFLGVELALYSVLTYMAASKTIDFLVYGFDYFLGVNIISAESRKVKQAIISELGFGVTVYIGRRGHTQKEQDILFCVCARLEVDKLRTVVTKIDKTAFITSHIIKDSYGGMLRKAEHLH